MLRWFRSGRAAGVRAAAVVLCVSSISLSGCASVGAEDESELTPAEQQMLAESREFNETVAGGAVAGAVVGAVVLGVLGALSNPDDPGRGAVQGAAIGAVAGGIIGGVDGYLTAKAREESNDNVRMTNAMAEDVRRDNERLARLVNTSNTVLAESRQRLQELKDQADKNQVSIAEVNAERARYERNRDTMQTALDELQKRRDNYKEASSQMQARGASTADLDAQIDMLNTQIAQLESNVAGMNSALTVTKVG
jgi:hypothetical protein